jgi:hypothetical protein
VLDEAEVKFPPKPIRRCFKCGEECDWCVKSNEARLAFPRATVPPAHDADFDKPEEHTCVPCFLEAVHEVP